MVGLAARVDPIGAHRAGSAGSRATTHRGAQASGYNQAVEVSRSARCGSSSPPRRSPACRSCAMSAATAPPISGRCASQRQAEAVRDAIQSGAAPPVHRQAVGAPRRSRRLHARGYRPLHGTVRGRQRRPGLSGTRSISCAGGMGGDVRPLDRSAAPSNSSTLSGGAALRAGGSASATASRPWSGPAPACSDWRALRRVEQIVAARPDGRGGWELSVIRSGRLAAAGVARAVTQPDPVVDALVATADVVDAAQPALVEESECILRWLEEPGTRLVRGRRPVVTARVWRRQPARLPRLARHPQRRPVRRSSRRCRGAQPACPGIGVSRGSPRCPYDDRVITAIVMVSVETDKIPEVAQPIAELDGVSEVYSVAGDVDLIAIVRVREFDQIAEVIAGTCPRCRVISHRHAHRVSRVLPARPRRDVLDRLQLLD